MVFVPSVELGTGISILAGVWAKAPWYSRCMLKNPLGTRPTSRRLSRCGAELRSLTSDADFELCLELQRKTWGEDFRELVPSAVLAISQKVGGVVAGAFEGGRLLGFVYGLSGIRHGELAHWSHMLAVREQDRGRGIGRDLKEFQKDLLLQLGIRVMYWTFDPLIARNAALNLVALGARPVEYVRNMYGADTGSSLHSGLGTDRLIVQWRFSEVSSSGNDTLNTAPPGHAQVKEYGFSAGGVSWIEIPRDIEGVKGTDREAALGWRDRTRSALEHRLGGAVQAHQGTPAAGGFQCVGLCRTGSGSAERFFYVFSEAESKRNRYEHEHEKRFMT